MFWVVLHHLFAARTPLRNRVLGCHFSTGLGRRNYYRVFRLKRIQSTTLGPKLTFWVVSHHLVAASAPFRNQILGCHFGTSSAQWNFFQDFLPKCIQSTTFGPKHMLWAVSHHLVAACRPLQNQVLECSLGPSLGRWNYCRVFQPKYIQSTHILGGFTPFGCSKCNVAKSGPMMLFGHEFGPMKLFLSFPAKTHPIHYFRSKTHILGGFALFGCCKCTVAKSGPRMPFGHEFRPTKLFSRFSTKMLPIHYVRYSCFGWFRTIW